MRIARRRHAKCHSTRQAGPTLPSTAGTVPGNGPAPLPVPLGLPPYQPLPTFFSPNSVWNTQVPLTATLDPKSNLIVNNLVNQEQSEANGMNTGSYGTRVYTVPPNQPPVHVTLDQGPDQAPMQAAFDDAPIPIGAQPSPGTDAFMVIWQPSTDTMWEFWQMSLQSDGWHANWGGRMYNVMFDPGYYRYVLDSQGGSVLEDPWWGATASSFPLVGGTITIADLESGQINHALAIQVGDTCANEWAAPAQRTDGNVTNDPSCVPEGAHFRLDPTLNLASLHLGHMDMMLAEAAQKYGLIVVNRSAGVGFQGEDPAVFQSTYGYNPYFGPAGQPGKDGALFDEFPTQFVPQFPWSHLQLLNMNMQTSPDMTPYYETPS